MDLTPPVLEIGPMQEKWTPVKEYFVNLKKEVQMLGLEYISNDIDEESQADIICDILELQHHVKEYSVGTIIALEVLEHVSRIWEIPDIFYNLLKPNGFVFLSVPYYFYRHSPFPDYWRISEDGLNLLFSSKFDINIMQIDAENDDRKPLHYTLIGRKK